MEVNLTKSDINLIKAAFKEYANDLETSIHCGKAYYKTHEPNDHYHKKLQKLSKLMYKLDKTCEKDYLTCYICENESKIEDSK